MNKKIILTLILSTFLGCSPIPKIAKNEIITLGNISTDTLGNQKLTFSNINWWKMYNDPVLDQLIDFALKENEDLKISVVIEGNENKNVEEYHINNKITKIVSREKYDFHGIFNHTLKSIIDRNHFLKIKVNANMKIKVENIKFSLYKEY